MWIRWNWIYILNDSSTYIEKIRPISTSIFPGKTATTSSNLFLSDSNTQRLSQCITLLNTALPFGNSGKFSDFRNVKSRHVTKMVSHLRHQLRFGKYLHFLFHKYVNLPPFLFVVLFFLF